MIGTIIYILGVIAAIWCVLDILKKNVSLITKILLIVFVLALSWIGVALYYFWLRHKV
ncbi:MAG: hypothetical protein J6X39_03895 [Bacteroidales bacterium]|jgi:hypothetical protein|nr:hypothetical protein [Bacteroidales bacterium]